MGYIIKNTSGLINTRLTDTARLKLSQGTFNIAYFQVGDSEVSYNTLPTNTYSQFNTFILEPSFNAQNSSGAPQSNKENIKYPLYVDGNTGNTYGIPFMDSTSSPVFNTASPRGFFTGGTGNTFYWSALTNSDYVINSNYTVQMNTLIGTNQMTLTFNSCDTDVVRGFAIGDIVTIFYDGEGSNTCECVNVVTPTPTPTISVTPSVTASPFATPTPSPTDPCLSPTPTPTPSATFCPTPTPSNACSTNTKANCVVKLQSCYPILTYRIVDMCLNTITLDRNTPDYSYLGNDCYARVLVYPPNMISLYDTITPSPHWNDSVINFESVCYTDQFDVKIWNMNIPWSEDPAGLDSGLYKDYTKFGSIGFLGSKEYFGYASSSGQTTTSVVYFNNSFGEPVIVKPEEQKTIAIIHYTNQTIDLFYGEKFALQPFDDEFDDTTGQARNFKLHIPTLMWHKNPDCCFGETFYIDPSGFDGLSLARVQYMKSSKNQDMNNPGLRYYNLWDTHPQIYGIPNRVGRVFPDSKIIIIDDEEIVAAMTYKSNRNWTLPAPKLSLITPNSCGDLTTSVDGILSASTEYLYVTYRLSNFSAFTNSLHCNYYIKTAGPNSECNNLSSQNVGVRFGNEFNCLSNEQVLPCWSSGFTFWFEFDPLTSPGAYAAYPFINTNQSLNGYPIFRSLTLEGGIYNIFFNGTQWILKSNGNLDDAVINFSSGGLIGNFTFDSGLGIVSGYTECSSNPELCVVVCEQNLSCNNNGYYKILSGTTELYLLSSFDYQDRIVYNSPAWEIYSASTKIASLGGLTQNDLPIGTWTPDILSVTGVTSSLYENCFTIGCNSFTAQTTSGQSVIRTVDCSYIISDNITGTTFSGCVLTFDGNFDASVVDISGTTNVGSGTTTGCTFPSTAATICNDACNVSSGFYADTFEIICQKVIGTDRPSPSEWKIIDYTSSLTSTTMNGLLTSSGITGTTFVITQDLYDNAPYYDLNDYITLTPQGFTGSQLNFGDEYYFYGNLETDIQATIYEMRYKINLSQVEFLSSSNPTWSPNTTPYMTEVGLYDSDKNLMIISKLQSPVLRQGIQQLLVKFDF
jgi:hypothetical protein